MASIITEGVITVLKTVYLDIFHSGSLKVKMFIIQVNNKIANAAGATEEQKIHYAISLLKESALK